MIVLRYLPALIDVADELHFGRAAARLGISQPQLSGIIHRVEAQCGVTLFCRRPQVRPTAEGEALISSARRALQETSDGIARARAIADGLSGIIRFGFAPVSIFSAVPTIFADFRREKPQFRLQLLERHSSTLWDDLSKDRLDLILARDAPPYDGMCSVEIIRSSIMIAVPADHELANAAAVSLADLKDEPFVFPSRSSTPQYYDRLIAGCHAAGLVPRIEQSVDAWSTILAFVASRLGVALVSEPLSGIGFPGVCFRPLRDPMLPASFWLSWDPRRETTGARLLRQRLEELSLALNE